ncbi:hypothetical protein C8R47DRAFT_1210800 [Mycena vitilis]|nr:hypothetical protein C8R47DRAFT_1210800 [Mycena vitilis]
MDAPLVDILLDSQDAELLNRIFRMLIDMGKRSGIPAYIRNSPPSAKLVSLISHADPKIAWGAWEALAVCCFPCHNGIQAAVAAGLIDKLLSAAILWRTTRFLRMLEYYLGPTCVDLIPLLLSPLRSSSSYASGIPETAYVRAGTEQEDALLYMLSFSIKNAEGARVFAQAGMDEDRQWGILDMLVDVPNPAVRKSVFFMLGHLARNTADVAGISLSNSVLVFLVSCLRDTNLDVIASAIAAVQRFILGVPVETEMCTAVDFLPALLDCPCREVRYAACQALGPQAVYESLLPTISTPQMYQRILPFLLQEDNELIATSIHRLQSLTGQRSPDPIALGILTILSRSPLRSTSPASIEYTYGNQFIITCVTVRTKATDGIVTVTGRDLSNTTDPAVTVTVA